MLALSLMSADLTATLLVIAFVVALVGLILWVMDRPPVRTAAVVGLVALAVAIAFFVLAWNAVAVT